MTRDAWLKAHPYLAPVAELCGRVESAAASLTVPRAVAPSWAEHDGAYEAGVPLLRSVDASVDLEPAGALASALIDALARGTAGKLADDADLLRVELVQEPEGPHRIVDWLLGDDAFLPSNPGLLRYVGWTALARYLAPVLASFAAWRVEERWLRPYCPACGALPAMAQLIGVDPGRQRFLACGHCGMRWRYRRTTCPFCERDSHRLGVVAVESEGKLRIDYCESCSGYLKTYDGAGEESLWLADWTSLHLDVVAHDRGLKRLAVSLFDLDALLQP